MPTYDYRCDNCGHEFELFQSMKDSPKKKCPQCAKLTLKRLIGTGAAVIFKGSGFYETDYRSASYRKSAEAEKKSASEGSGSGDSPKGESGSKPKGESGSKSEPTPTTKPEKTPPGKADKPKADPKPKGKKP